jgi:hypothetical protein
LLVVDALGDSHHKDEQMASSGKHKTTMAKLSREAKLRERRVEKNQRKQIRKDTQAAQPYDPFGAPHESFAGLDVEQLESPDGDPPQSADVDPPKNPDVAVEAPATGAER